jgi:hypothetical protein
VEVLSTSPAAWVWLAMGSNRSLEFELGAGFERSCVFALGLALSQVREHGLGPFGRADPHPRRKPHSLKSKVQGPKLGWGQVPFWKGALPGWLDMSMLSR